MFLTVPKKTVVWRYVIISIYNGLQFFILTYIIDFTVTDWVTI